MNYGKDPCGFHNMEAESVNYRWWIPEAVSLNRSTANQTKPNAACSIAYMRGHTHMQSSFRAGQS